jgi:hypothetical protein
LPPAPPERARVAARLIFENSTVCHLVDELVLYALIGFFGLGFVFQVDDNDSGYMSDVCLLAWVKFSMESLILAQDERWRRA